LFVRFKASLSVLLVLTDLAYEHTIHVFQSILIIEYIREDGWEVSLDVKKIEISKSLFGLLIKSILFIP
jgi:hypothetical protein